MGDPHPVTPPEERIPGKEYPGTLVSSSLNLVLHWANSDLIASQPILASFRALCVGVDVCISRAGRKPVEIPVFVHGPLPPKQPSPPAEARGGKRVERPLSAQGSSQGNS